MVAAPMLFTTATASSTTKMTTSRDAIVKCDLISVRGTAMGGKLMSSGPCCQSWSVALRSWRAWLIAWCCGYGGVGLLFNVLHHKPDFSPAFWCSPQGSSYCLSRPRRLLET